MRVQYGEKFCKPMGQKSHYIILASIFPQVQVAIDTDQPGQEGKTNMFVMILHAWGILPHENFVEVDARTSLILGPKSHIATVICNF